MKSGAAGHGVVCWSARATTHAGARNTSPAVSLAWPAGVGNALGLVRLVKAARRRAAAAAGRHLPPRTGVPGFVDAALQDDSGEGGPNGADAGALAAEGNGCDAHVRLPGVRQAAMAAAAALDGAAAELRSPAAEGGRSHWLWVCVLLMIDTLM